MKSGRENRRGVTDVGVENEGLTWEERLAGCQ